MENRTLGRTGLSASVMGLGCGGPSRLGMRAGITEDEAANVVRAALDLGINFLDTAEAYGTEGAVGRAIADVPRDSVIVSTKVGVGDSNGPLTPDAFAARVDGCLTRLDTDYVDILHLHGVSLEAYPRALADLFPVMERLRDAGKVRFLGITEAFGPDPSHRMLRAALPEGPWEVIMVGFNLLNQSARETVFPITLERGIGTLCMFAVRRALSQPDRLREQIAEMAANGLIRAEDFDKENPLGFLTADGIASSVTEAAYRFCRDEPGMGVVLSGTGNIEHLKENKAALEAPPLPAEVTERLRTLFAGVDSVSGN